TSSLCGCTSSLCGCTASLCGCTSSLCGCTSSLCGCTSSLCGCTSSLCGCTSSLCGCTSSLCGCTSSLCGCTASVQCSVKAGRLVVMKYFYMCFCLEMCHSAGITQRNQILQGLDGGSRWAGLGDCFVVTSQSSRSPDGWF
uniref:Uncharacterized protein n=1 Tax=Seriola lalandi dorsalis TaxID=1841481 RepID=A0A3B4WKD7_SERLL